MKILKYLLFLILAISFTGFESCKKYEEGPWIVLQSKKCRLVGVWNLEYLVIEDIDSTAYALNGCHPVMVLDLTEGLNSTGRVAVSSLTYPPADCKNYIAGSWSLLNKQKDLDLVFRYHPPDSISYKPIGPFLAEGRVTWRIKRLTKDQLWMDVDYENHHCWIHLKKIEQ